eukprot:TRINITY_DN12450_c0_g1_i1.p1 TRINITY_DN12450_c0_g1~~TRINITY_DN12450_c0_g1_i1.p1  ORF type:complete len:237 (-),score=45.82 TRINITY_DN12450_c0_g1_i1:263-946(-)
MNTPQVLTEKPYIVAFCGGETHSMMLYNIGKLFVCGNNKNGQWGVETIPEKKIQILLSKDNSITKIACGLKHCMYLTNEGSVYVYGFNDYGQLGLGHTMEQTTPLMLGEDSFTSELIELMEIKKKIAKNIFCGGFHSFILYDDGELFTMGCNRNGQLGLGPSVKNQTTPILLIKEPGIKDVVCGSEHSIYTLDSGEIFVFGNNRSGQLGLGHNVNQKNSTTFENRKH